MIASRETVAKLVGYPSFGHKVLEGGMAQKPDVVAEFLGTLQTKLLPLLEVEMANMRTLQSRVDADSGAAGQPIMPCERYFLGCVARATMVPQGVADYFSVGACMEGA
jgi:Zn-dependent oligopeptidase